MSSLKLLPLKCEFVGVGKDHGWKKKTLEEEAIIRKALPLLLLLP